MGLTQKMTQEPLNCGTIFYANVWDVKGMAVKFDDDDDQDDDDDDVHDGAF